MYFGDSLSDPYYTGGDINNGKHPCARCGVVRTARKPWSFCVDCRQVDPAMCEARDGLGRVRTTRFEEDFNEYDDEPFARPDRRTTSAA